MQTKLDYGLLISLDLKGKIQKILSNPIKTLELKERDYFMHYIDASSYDKFLKYFEHTKQEGFSFGGLINVVTTKHPKELTLSFLKAEDIIYVVGLIEPPESVRVLNEIIKLNNTQTTKMRALKQEEHLLKSDSLIFEQLSQLNSDLVNTKRALEQKNQQLKQMNQTLEELSTKDYLTKLKNRRGFFNEYQDYETIYDKVLLMIDFNHFKQVNDDYGHHRGDEALIFFANQMKACIKDGIGDAYRLGGDEFLVLTTPDIYQKFLENYPKILDGLKTFHEDLSLSYGVVKIDKGTVLNSKTLNTLLKQADRAMYAMKKERR